jgi:superoxide reductase
VNGGIQVKIGSIAHPMLPEHYIEWIALDTEAGTEFVYLKPGMDPKAEFQDANSGVVYEYCSLHGLWKADF